MLSRVNGAAVWMDAGQDDDDDAVSWTRGAAVAGGGGVRTADDMSLSTFRSMLDDDWYVNAPAHHDFGHPHVHHAQEQGLLKELPFSSPAVTGGGEGMLLNVDSSASCSPSSVFNLDPKSCLSSLLNSISSSSAHPFDVAGFDLGCDPSLLPPPPPQAPLPSAFLTNGFPDLLLGDASGFGGGGGGGVFDNPPQLLFNRSKLLRPLEIFPPMGAQPTLFQKRAAQRLGPEGKALIGDLLEEREEDDLDEASMDVSGLNYDSDEVGGGDNNYNFLNGGGKVEDAGKANGSNVNSSVTVGDQKGKKKGMPAKNLMAERRRRKKLNDRLYMLRSVVPKISKMDRASILGDAIEYLKELLQRINDLHNELESTPSSSSLPSASSFHPLTPTPATLPCRVKEELCPSSLPSPNNQPARVEVRLREGRAVNIHMFCARRPGLLLSTMRALDGLGLDIQQAVISCFNGFALDVFRAEQCKEGPDILPDEIKAVLLHSAGFQGAM